MSEGEIVICYMGRYNYGPFESALNPRLCNKLFIGVSVIDDLREFDEPFLLIRRRKVNTTTCVSLIKPGYYFHPKFTQFAELHPLEKADLITIMKSPWNKHYQELPDGSLRKSTGYEAAVDIWVETYENGDYSKFTFDKNGDLVMPDYSLL